MRKRILVLISVFFVVLLVTYKISNSLYIKPLLACVMVNGHCQTEQDEYNNDDTLNSPSSQSSRCSGQNCDSSPPIPDRCGSKQCDGGGCKGDVDCNSGRCYAGQCKGGGDNNSSNSNSSTNSSSSSTGPVLPLLYSVPVMATSSAVYQNIQLPVGIYMLSANIYTAIIRGGGAYLGLMCNDTTCGGNSVQGSYLAVIVFPETKDFETRAVPFIIPSSGAGKNYQVRVVVGDGSEAYVYHINLTDLTKNYLNNPELRKVKNSPQTIILDEPDNWGDGGDNKVGYYYGRYLDDSMNSPDYVPPDPVSTLSAVVKLNMKIKLQGVPKKPKVVDPIKVKVKLGGGSLTESTASQTINFNVGDDGLWSGSATFDVVPGGKYKLYVKGPKHLQKIICVATPTEKTGGTYTCSDGNITLSASDNTIDMTQILMLVGDLPEKGVQNGVIDAYDTSYVRQHLQSTKADELAIGDLNYDGVIDGQDASLIQASLSIKYDEE